MKVTAQLSSKIPIFKREWLSFKKHFVLGFFFDHKTSVICGSRATVLFCYFCCYFGNIFLNVKLMRFCGECLIKFSYFTFVIRMVDRFRILFEQKIELSVCILLQNVSEQIKLHIFVCLFGYIRIILK